MPGSDGLSCLEKRDLLNQPAASVKSLIEWGERMERAGLLHDALNFYEKAGANDAVVRLREIAKEEGDLFLYRRTSRALAEEPTSEDWVALGGRAAALGKTAYAAEAYRLAGRDDLIASVSPPAVDQPQNPSLS